MPKKRKQDSSCSHCTTCGEPMNLPPDKIVWHNVYVCRRVRCYMDENGTLPPHTVMVEIDNGTGSDPCDDCCCGSCGSRKQAPTQVCC